MDSRTYIPLAIRTESAPESLVIDQLALHAMMQIAAGATAIVDQFKRKIFYAKDFDQHKLLEALNRTRVMSQFMGSAVALGEDIGTPMAQSDVDAATAGTDASNIKLEHINIRLLHAALGCFTESGELVEAIQKQYETGSLDLVNFGEEIGDIEWYQAIGFDATGVTEASCREKNIAKLQKRYPEKFDAVAAVNRDLTGERTILEGKTDSDGVTREGQSISAADVGSIADILGIPAGADVATELRERNARGEDAFGNDAKGEDQ